MSCASPHNKTDTSNWFQLLRLLLEREFFEPLSRTFNWIEIVSIRSLSPSTRCCYVDDETNKNNGNYYFILWLKSRQLSLNHVGVKNWKFISRHQLQQLSHAAFVSDSTFEIIFNPMCVLHANSYRSNILLCNLDKLDLIEGSTMTRTFECWVVFIELTFKLKDCRGFSLVEQKIVLKFRILTFFIIIHKFTDSVKNSERIVLLEIQEQTSLESVWRFR